MRAVWDGKTSGVIDANFDCYIAEALLSEGRAFGTLDDTLARYKVKNVDELASHQQKRFDENPQLSSLYYDIELPLAKVLGQMEKKGILLDIACLEQVGKELDQKITSLQDEIAKETGDININSSVQLGHFLAEKMGVPLGKTRTGKFATNEGELSKFADQFAIIHTILTFRELSKLRSTYVNSLIDKADDNGRIHTTYNQVFVNTGRLASSNPNLQNIPTTSVMGQKIKSCFIASPDHVLVSFDYSQQELRILAHLAQEEALIEAFKKGEDVHSLTASKLFNVSLKNVTKQQRTVGKTINFGIIYGMSGYGMSRNLRIPVEDAERFIRQFYASYPSIRTYYDTYLKNARINGYAETMLGRRRFVFDSQKKFIDNGMRRVLMNYPIQGSAADLMKKGMVDVQKQVLSKHSEVSLLLTIHDDLVFEIPDRDVAKRDEIINEIRHVLTSVYPLSVPLEVEVKIGKRWGEMEKLLLP